jgi:hypothetical protein
VPVALAPRCHEMGGLTPHEPRRAPIGATRGQSVHNEKWKLAIDVNPASVRQRAANCQVLGKPPPDLMDETVADLSLSPRHC